MRAILFLTGVICVRAVQDDDPYSPYTQNSCPNFAGIEGVVMDGEKPALMCNWCLAPSPDPNGMGDSEATRNRRDPVDIKTCVDIIINADAQTSDGNAFTVNDVCDSPLIYSNGIPGQPCQDVDDHCTKSAKAGFAYPTPRISGGSKDMSRIRTCVKKGGSGGSNGTPNSGGDSAGSSVVPSVGLVAALYFMFVQIT